MWQEKSLAGLTDDAFERFTDELESSARGTPKGKQRRAAGATNEAFTKLINFLEALRRKHSI
jgi:hypothetical protein